MPPKRRAQKEKTSVGVHDTDEPKSKARKAGNKLKTQETVGHEIEAESVPSLEENAAVPTKSRLKSNKNEQPISEPSKVHETDEPKSKARKAGNKLKKQEVICHDMEPHSEPSIKENAVIPTKSQLKSNKDEELPSKVTSRRKEPNTISEKKEAPSKARKGQDPDSIPQETKVPSKSRKGQDPDTIPQETKAPSKSRKPQDPDTIPQETKLSKLRKRQDLNTIPQETKAPSKSRKRLNPVVSQDTEAPSKSGKFQDRDTTPQETEAPSKLNGNESKVNTTKTEWESIDFSCKKKNAEGLSSNFKITSWNIDGLKAWVKKDGLKILDFETPDVLCLQETKCTEDSLPPELKKLKGYSMYWCSSAKNGYAGVGLLSIRRPLKVTYGIDDEELDQDGRCITAEFDKFFLVSVYVPNAGRKLVTLDKRLTWNEVFKDYIKKLDAKKPVIICGDLNVAHNEIDLKNPKANKKNAGFTNEEREGMTDFLEGGFVDTFRALYPNVENAYTFWTYMGGVRKKNIGWRLDYFLVSKRIEKKVCDSVALNKVFGSDHCPITLHINL